MEYAEYLFAENGHRRYVLTDDELSVTGKGLHLSLRLDGLEPDYRITRRRSPSFSVGIIGLFLSIAFGIYSAFYDTLDIVDLPLTFATVFTVISLLVLFSSLGTVVRAVFKSTAGPDVIEISRAGPDAARFDSFVSEVSSRIRRAGR